VPKKMDQNETSDTLRLFHLLLEFYVHMTKEMNNAPFIQFSTNLSKYKVLSIRERASSSAVFITVKEDELPTLLIKQYLTDYVTLGVTDENIKQCPKYAEAYQLCYNPKILPGGIGDLRMYMLNNWTHIFDALKK
jgi:hypothetical protein